MINTLLYQILAFTIHQKILKSYKKKKHLKYQLQWHYLELLAPEMIKLRGDEYVPHLEINEVALVHYNIVYNDYQQDSRDLFIFLPNKLFSQLITSCFS